MKSGNKKSEFNHRAVYGLIAVAGGLAVSILFLMSDGKPAASQAADLKTLPETVAVETVPPTPTQPHVAKVAEAPKLVSSDTHSATAKPVELLKPTKATAPKAKADEAWPMVAVGAVRNDSDSVSIERAVLITEGLDEGKLGLVMNKSVVLSTRAPYKRVSIGAPEIADVNAIGPTNILVTAKKPGTAGPVPG